MPKLCVPNLASLAGRHPRCLEAAIRIDRVPAWVWLLAQALALWPAWLWMARRWADGSDDPLGLLALAALAVLVWQQRRALRAAPSLTCLATASVLTLCAAVARTGLHLGPFDLPAWPPLLSTLLSVLALASALLAFLQRPRSDAPRGAVGAAALPVLGLAVLALPLLSSLQFYAGYPLRVLTAALSRCLLMPFFSVTREGASLWVDGRWVIVDAPCSGVQMVWLGYFTACITALFMARCSSRGFVARLPLVGAWVLIGNVVRNACLVAAEGAGRPLPAWGHEALGLLVLALVCGSIVASIARAPRRLAGAEVAGGLPALVVVPAGLHTASGGRHVDTLA